MAIILLMVSTPENIHPERMYIIEGTAMINTTIDTMLEYKTQSYDMGPREDNIIVIIGIGQDGRISNIENRFELTSCCSCNLLLRNS
mgnify:CR=1 FL=1